MAGQIFVGFFFKINFHNNKKSTALLLFADAIDNLFLLTSTIVSPVVPIVQEIMDKKCINTKIGVWFVVIQRLER